MSIFSKALHGVGKLVGGVGDIVSKAAPLASFIPGVGVLGSAAAGAIGGLMGKANDHHVTLGNTLGSIAGGAALGGIGGYGIDKMQGMAAANGGGIGGFLSGLTHGSGIPGVGGLNPALGQTPGNTGGLLGQIAGFAKNNPELLLGGIGALSNARQASGSADMRNQAIDLVMQDYNDRKPFRDLALQRLSTLGQSPNLPQMPVDTNPYAKAVGRIG